ncbi:MAG: hypothetical protein CMH46_00620 [Muricauda sp.]|nr:hypothetical protein [Allomuricauda sp.]
MKRTTTSKRRNLCLQKLLDYFNGTVYCGCFTEPWLCPDLEKYVWQPKEQKNQAFIKAVNTWIYLIDVTDNSFIQRCLYQWIDINNLKIINVDYGKYPTVRLMDFMDDRVTCRFITHIIMDILPPCKQTKDKNKILHLLSKACPKRCQIRNLKEIVHQYATADTETYRFLLEVMKKSIFGTYHHAKEMLCFEARHIFYVMFQFQMQNRDFFLKWFQNNNHQVFIFFCLKEYLCDAIRQVKSVNDFIEKKWKWSIFDNQVVYSMDAMRKIINTIAKREYSLMHRSDWISSAESFLSQISKQHIKLFRTSSNTSYLSKLETVLNKYLITENAQPIIKHEIKQFFISIMQRTRDPKILYQVLAACDIPLKVINDIYCETFNAESFRLLSYQQLFMIKEFCRLLELMKHTSIFVLPQHFYRKQKEALFRKESCADNHNHNIGYVCFVCKDVKFFLTKFSASSRHSNKLARGSLRVVVDNDESIFNRSRLSFVCGRKPERHVKNSKRKWNDDQKAISRKIFKEKQRNMLSRQCVATPLQEIDLLGHALQFNNKMIVLCTSCANVCILDPRSFKYSNVINCQVCFVGKTETCIKCHNETTCNKVLVFNRQKPRMHQAPMCTSCTNVYALKQPVIL